MNRNHSLLLQSSVLVFCMVFLCSGQIYSQSLDHLPEDLEDSPNSKINPSAGELSIHHIDLHDDFDSTLIIGTNGATVLIGGGNADMGREYVLPYLRKIGVKRIDYMVASYEADSYYGARDNITGLSTVLTSEIEVKYVLIQNTEYIYPSSFIKTARSNATVGLFYVNAGQEFKLGDAVLRCIFADGLTVDRQFGDWRYDNRDQGIVFMLIYGNFQYFYGDSISGTVIRRRHNVEAFLLPDLYDVDAMRLVANGSGESNSSDLLNKLNPEVAIVACQGNRNDHSGISRARGKGIDVFQTGKVYGRDIAYGDVVVRVGKSKKYQVNNSHYYFKDDVIPKGNQAPKAHFSITRHSIEYRKVIFDVSASTDDQKIKKFTLDFGDGTKKTFKLKKPITHIYPYKNKSYFPKLTAMDKWEFTDTYKEKVQINSLNFKVSHSASTKNPLIQTYYNVYVRVTTKNGTPVRNAKVTAKIIYSSEPYSDFKQGYTDADGRVTLTMFARTYLTWTSTLNITVYYNGIKRGSGRMDIKPRW